MEIFENDLGQVAIADIKDLPSMLGYGFDGSIINFYEISIGAGTITTMDKDETLAFYKSLKRRNDRINFWLYLKERGWTKNKRENEKESI